MARIVYVDKPKDRYFVDKRGNHVLVKWSPVFAPRWNNRYWRAQRFIDSAVLYGAESFITFDTGDLIRSGRRNTEIGSGWVKWGDKRGHYARPVFYGRRAPGRKGPKVTKPMKWFQRWRNVHGDSVVRQAKKMVGE
jgi:hypothetical protein